MNEININFKTYKVILFFLFTLFQFAFALFGLLNGVILLIIPFLLFIGPYTIWTLNFIHLFKKNTTLVIKKDKIIYSPINLEIKISDIEFISFFYGKSVLLEINLNNYSEYKRQLSRSIFGWLLILNYKFMKKNSIFINVSVLDIKQSELSKLLKINIPKTKTLL